MSGALCGPSNALQNFQKQASADRTLQQDRISARQAPTEGFRSAPGPNAGILDAEFEAFQAGNPLQPGYPESDLFLPRSSASPFRRNDGQPQPPDWASDFQNMRLNEARLSPIPPSQFRQHAPLQHTEGWHQEFLGQQNQPSEYHNQLQQIPTGQTYDGWSYRNTGSLMSQHHNTLSPIAQQKQPEKEAESFFDEAAFEKAFNAASEEMQQLDESADRHQTRVDAGLHNIQGMESQEPVDHIRIGSDRILDEAQTRTEEGNDTDDGEELARTAGHLLEKVQGDSSQKFQESNFLTLMRQLRDREARVEGNKVVNVSQPLHPGGSDYPIDHTLPENFA